MAYVSAKSADDFTSSIGVGTKIDSYNPAYNNVSRLLAQLDYLGIENVRDGTPIAASLSMYITLAKAGIHFNLGESNPYIASGQMNAAADVARAHQLEAAVPGAVLSFEGANEYTTNSYSLSGQSSAGNLAWGVADAAALQKAVLADPLFAKALVVAPSAIQLDSLPAFGNSVSASNAHVYGYPGEQLQDRLINSIRYAQASAPGKPVYVTETGISTAGFTASNGGTADEATQAIVNVNAILSSYAAGADMTFLYELVDNPWASGAVEQSFGLFHTDGTPKPAATAIGNLMHILEDGNTGTLKLSGLDYSISGLPSTASSMLLQEADGTFDLVLWNGRASLYDGSKAVSPASSNVTVTLGASGSASVYDPLVSASAIKSLGVTNSITVGLSAAPIIIEIKPASASGGAPSTPVVDTPSTPVVDTPSTPVVDTPSTPVSNTTDVWGTAGADRLTAGATGNYYLHGGAGNDMLTGTAKAQSTLAGGAGDDSYAIYNATDVVVENPGQGTDWVGAYVSYTVSANVENIAAMAGGLTLHGNALDNMMVASAKGGALYGDAGNDSIYGAAGVDILYGEAGNDMLSGMAGNDTLYGGAGNDFLDGGAGNDQMYGGTGDDIYVVDSSRDKVTEYAGEGIDTVRTTLNTYTLPSNVERLEFIGSGNFTGNGNALANEIIGGNGNDRLDGGAGSDILVGGAGADRFVFDTALGPTNIDLIKDFNAGEDKILLENAIFKSLKQTGTLAASAFTIGTAAADASDRIIYDDHTGAVYYDSDGTGSAAAVQFATIGVGLHLTQLNFQVI